MQTVRDPKLLARMNLAFDLYEAGESMMRENLRRQFPDESPEEIEARLLEWLGNPSAELISRTRADSVLKVRA